MNNVQQCYEILIKHKKTVGNYKSVAVAVCSKGENNKKFTVSRCSRNCCVSQTLFFIILTISPVYVSLRSR